jgi:hypothetical protein
LIVFVGHGRVGGRFNVGRTMDAATVARVAAARANMNDSGFDPAAALGTLPAELLIDSDASCDEGGASDAGAESSDEAVHIPSKGSRMYDYVTKVDIKKAIFDSRRLTGMPALCRDQLTLLVDTCYAGAWASKAWLGVYTSTSYRVTDSHLLSRSQGANGGVAASGLVALAAAEYGLRAPMRDAMSWVGTAADGRLERAARGHDFGRSVSAALPPRRALAAEAVAQRLKSYGIEVTGDLRCSRVIIAGANAFPLLATLPPILSQRRTSPEKLSLSPGPGRADSSAPGGTATRHGMRRGHPP